MRRQADRPGWSGSPKPSARLRIAPFLLLVPLVAGLLIASPVGPVAGDDLSDAIARQKRLETQLKSQRAQIAELERQQAALTSGIAATAANLEAVNADLASVERQVVALTSQVNIARGRVHALDAQVRELDLQLAVVEVREAIKAAELEVRMGILAERIRIAYDADRTPLLEALLSSGTFTDALAEVGYHLDVAEEDRALAEEIVRDREALAALHATVEATRASADELRTAAVVQKADLEARTAELTAVRDRLAVLREETRRLLAEQEAAYAAMVAKEARLDDAIAETQRAQEQLEEEIARLIRERQRNGSIPSEYNGSLEWPLAGRITQEFGCTGFRLEPRLGECRHFHRGIDIAAPMYSPIRAAGDGVVLLAGPSPNSTGTNRAWIVVIAHSSRLVTWYVHLDNRSYPPTVKVGQWVSTGEVIGYVGMTGRTTGPHLHWAVQLNGTFANPRLFL